MGNVPMGITVARKIIEIAGVEMPKSEDAIIALAQSIDAENAARRKAEAATAAEEEKALRQAMLDSSELPPLSGFEEKL